VIIFAASSTSNIERSDHQVTLIRTHFAQFTESSRRGESIADFAASAALFSQDPYQIHINADHALYITDLTSAKSTLINQFQVITSETHAIPCLNTSSTTMKASVNGVCLSIIDKILSFGTVINVSTLSFSSSYHHIACFDLLCHSNEKGLVTTQIVKIHISFATSATIGAAQVQVHPHKPQVTKTMSAQFNAFLISSLDSSAAVFQFSGFHQAHNHLVAAFQIVILCSAFEDANACESVFIAIN
jgi:hypothetical protein